MEDALEERYVNMLQNAAVSGGVRELVIDLYKYGKQCDAIIAQRDENIIERVMERMKSDDSMYGELLQRLKAVEPVIASIGRESEVDGTGDATPSTPDPAAEQAPGDGSTAAESSTAGAEQNPDTQTEDP